MVLYHDDGRVIKAHDDYLEREARKEAIAQNYTDQIDIAKSKDPGAYGKTGVRVHIVVNTQYFKELYYQDSSILCGRYLDLNNRSESAPLPEGGLDRRTLMKCCSLADEFFTFNPDKTILYLPVEYPRRLMENVPWDGFSEDTKRFPEMVHDPVDIAAKRKYFRQADDQMAFIRDKEIKNYIVPWITQMERVVEKLPEMEPMNKLPLIQIPENLLEKIHLYNAMLQLGIASFFQRPLIDALILQMYQMNLEECHLDTLEMTVCRFYSRGVAILDPVINHLIGTYPLRSVADRRNAEPPSKLRVLLKESKEEQEAEKNYLPDGGDRNWLDFKELPARRKDFPEDTVSLPPRLEVLGHCLRHWSGIRRNGSTAAAHTGFPLNVGRVKKFYRRQRTDPIRTEENDEQLNYVDYSTYRLAGEKDILKHPPGAIVAADKEGIAGGTAGDTEEETA
jgi:hypothetical protein